MEATRAAQEAPFGEEAALAFARRLMIVFAPVVQPGAGFGGECSASQLKHAMDQPVMHAAHVLAISHVVSNCSSFLHDPYDLQRPLDDHDDIANAEVGGDKTDVRDQLAQVQRMANDPIRSGQDDATIGQQKTERMPWLSEIRVKQKIDAHCNKYFSMSNYR
ncbi:hypothetical protein [Paraburkholderia sediminicola]|uniref:hypothetical protein n=1 Tax=Paraburkholderia sediminicola TaxID=458836 RepID=UPI0038BA518B